MPSRKEEIVEIAQDLIDSVGYSTFSYADLEKTLGIRKASIHHHFPKKEILGLAVLEKVSGFLQERHRITESSSQKGWEKVMQIIGPGCERAGKTGKVCTLVSLQHDYGSLPESMQKALTQLSKVEVEFLAATLEKERSEGNLDFTGDGKEKASLILSAVKGAMHYAKVMGPEYLESVLKGLQSGLTA